MLQNIMNILNSPGVISVDILAEKLNCDTQSITAALALLKQMGYIEDIYDQRCTNNMCCANGKSCHCGTCGNCSTGMKKISGHIYSVKVKPD